MAGLLVGLAVTSLIACGTADPGVTATRSRQSENEAPDTTTPDGGTTPTGDTTPDGGTTPTGDTTAPGDPDPNDICTRAPIEPVPDGIVDFGDAKTPQCYDGFLVAAFQDIEQFWGEQFPLTYGGDFDPLEGGIFAAYPARTDPIPGCGREQTNFENVDGNAFYCIDGDFMAYDDENLIPSLVQDLGEGAVGIVLAHEFGHAVQARANEFGQPTILKEQQADCFAGAWAAHVARGESDTIQFGDADIKSGLIAMIQLRDPVEISGGSDEDAHGTGFDRVGAFQDGFNGGPERCKPFFDENRILIDIPFDRRDPTGNLPFDQIIDGGDVVNNDGTAFTGITGDLVEFWTQVMQQEGVDYTAPTVVLYPTKGPFPSCEGIDERAFPKNSFYCASTNQVLLDEDFGRDLADDPLFGDMSVGYLLAQGFSESVQVARGSDLGGVDRALADDCLTGVWVADIVPASPTAPAKRQLLLSAGDLDEAIITAIVRSDQSSDVDRRGTAFEKIDSFRNGVLNGIDACDANG